MKEIIGIIVLFLFIAGCSPVDVEVVNMEGKILMVVAPDGFADEEYLEPKEVFAEAGVEVTTASKGVEVAKGRSGATAKVDMDISDVVAYDYNAVVFVGGPGAKVYFDDETVHKIARDAVEAGRVVGAICIAPSILANAGLLEGKKATSFESEQKNLEGKGTEYTGDDVTVDGKIVTGNGPKAAMRFAHAVVNLLE